MHKIQDPYSSSFHFSHFFLLYISPRRIRKLNPPPLFGTLIMKHRVFLSLHIFIAHYFISPRLEFISDSQDAIVHLVSHCYHWVKPRCLLQNCLWSEMRKENPLTWSVLRVILFIFWTFASLLLLCSENGCLMLYSSQTVPDSLSADFDI